jgi:hypothetical protein
MKTPTALLLTLVTSIMSITTTVRASDVDDILKEISGDSKKSSSSESSSTSSSSSQNTTLKRTSSDSEGGGYSSSSSSDAPKPKKKAVVKQAAPRPQAPQQPSITVWNPRDKLPKDVSGQGVAGNFVIQGSSSEGTLILVPAEDADNPFARQYWVVNRNYAGGSPNVLVPMGQREMVQVSPSQPLIFIGRGILPGVYNVQAQ